MTALVNHLVKGLVSKPDEVRVNTVDGEASVLLELTVAPEDLEAVKGVDGETLRAIRAVLSAASGRRKAVLELVGADSGLADSADSNADEPAASQD